MGLVWRVGSGAVAAAFALPLPLLPVPLRVTSVNSSCSWFRVGVGSYCGVASVRWAAAWLVSLVGMRAGSCRGGHGSPFQGS